MTVAAAMDTPIAALPSAHRIARVDIIQDVAAAEPVWRQFETSAHLATPYQRFDFQAAWLKHVATAEGVQPTIVIAYDPDQQPLLLLPLVVGRENGMRVASFPGGKHVTFNMPLWRRDFADSATRSEMETLLKGIHARAGNIDVLALLRQPQTWRGIANPMALLAHQPSTNDCPVLIITPDTGPNDRVSSSMRKRLKTKEAKYKGLPGYGYMHATTPADVTRVLDMFFAVKPLRMAEQGLPDVFAEPGVEAFLRDACAAPRSGGYAIDIHALVCDEEVIAMFAGVADEDRFSMMFNTYTMSANAKYSPGLILMRTIVDYYAERGIRSLDLGIGEGDYKRMFCKDDEVIFDSYIPLTTRGRLGALGLSSVAHAKRMVKQSPALLQMAQKLRGAFQRS
ncbi:GNAT family N-acetyltransferase [Tardiphaga alba]|uniref:GNAT family N-acetyltransferase n=1 Tax=Tardiphaga alba TaxID=340268 RepID=A0ABX8A946_9BRAD|nr:GNAT family N-acetyltransferase [Tardiphaga alba]QUS40261.1 GNAT family N-acetyltransferase [Tardiphaga alba]